MYYYLSAEIWCQQIVVWCWELFFFFLQGSYNRGPFSLGGSWGLMGWSWLVIDTHRSATDDLTVMAAGCGHCMLVISAGAPIRSLDLSIPDAYRYCGHLSVYCVTA